MNVIHYSPFPPPLPSLPPPHTIPTSSLRVRQIDPPEEIVEAALSSHIAMIRQMKGVPGERLVGKGMRDKGREGVRERASG